jgi:hypothetical protein
VFVVLAIVGVLFLLFSGTNMASVHASIGLYILSTLSFLSFVLYVGEHRYALVLTPFLYLYTSIAIVAVYRRVYYRTVAVVCVMALVCTADALVTRSLVFVPENGYVLEWYTPQPNFRAAYDAVYPLIEETDFVISAYPYLDSIYLQKSDYAIPISYTGRTDEDSMYGSREYYSGTPRLSARGHRDAIDKLEELRRTGNVFITLDSLAMRRIDSDVWEYIVSTGEEVFTDTDYRNGQSVRVYQISKIDTM